MADRYAHEIEEMGNTEFRVSGPGVRGNGYVEQVEVPRMSAVDEVAMVDDLGIEFDTEVETQILNEVEEANLSPTIEDIVRDDGVLGDRGLFTWKWEWYIFGEPLTLDCVADEYRQAAQEAKTLMGIYITLVDDVGEKLGDEATFWELAKTAYPGIEPDWEREDIDSDYADGIQRVWEQLLDQIRSAPRFDEFVDVLLFNLRQTIQSMDYARVSADDTALMNPEEVWYYDTQAIGLFVTWTVDLMYSPEFDTDDFRTFRRLVYELQHMWRLGNWIITWEREVYEQDYSAGIFVEAINQGIVDETDLERLERGEIAPERLIGRIEVSGIVEQFIAHWQRRRDRLYEQDFGMASLDSDELVAQMEWLMQSHLATEGRR